MTMVTTAGPGEAEEPLTVRGLLAEPPLRASRVLAGEGLDTPVTWCVPWSEVLAGEEPLAGVGVHVRVAEALREPDAGAAALRAVLARRPAALLVHGDGTRLPAAALGAARCPVVQLPATASFLVCNRIVAEKTLIQAAHVLKYGVTVHRTLGELLYQGAGLPALGRQLAKLSRCPAFILDAQGEVTAYEYLGTGAVPDPSEVVRLLREGEQRHLETDSPRVVRLDLEDRPVTCVVAPIVLGRVRYGWVVIVELDHPAAPHDLAQHRVIADQAVTIIGSEMLRLRSVEAARERARGDFVHALLHGRFANPHDLVGRAAHHEFDLEAVYAVIVAHAPAGADGPDAAGAGAALLRRAQEILPRRGARTLATYVGDVLVVVRRLGARGPGPAAGPPARSATGSAARPAAAGPAIAGYAAALAAELSERTGSTCSVTYGRPGAGARGVAESYREARIALGVCDRLGIDRVSGYAELRVFAALGDLAASREGLAFAREVLAPLRAPEAAASGLEAAVLVYVQTGGNLNETARRLRVHRNTMLYKLQRASRLLGLDLREPENLFTLWLAHRVDLLGEVQAGVDSESAPLSPGAGTAPCTFSVPPSVHPSR